MRQILEALCFSLLLSCASQPTKLQRDPAPANLVQQYKKAQTLAQSKRPQDAIQILDKITSTAPQSDVADDSWLLKGQIHYDLGQFSDAYQSFVKVVESRYFSPLEPNARLGAARSALQLNQFGPIESLAKGGLAAIDLTPQQRAEFHELLLKNYLAKNAGLDAVEQMVHLSENHPESVARERYRLQAMDFVESRLTEEEVADIAGNRKYSFLRLPALFRLGTYLNEQRSFSSARRYLEEVVQMAPDSEYAERATELLTQIRARQIVDPKTIGVVLPLSGKLAPIGYRTLQGIQLGLGIYGKDSSNIKLAIIDSQGNADTARRAVERLVTEDHVIAIIGSLTSKTAVAVASKAEEFGVPSIALSQKSDITQVGETVFRNAMTSEMQVKHLVDVAMNKMGLKTFAILFPNDPYGVEYSNLFWDEVKARGGEIRAAQSYESGETDFRDPIRRLVGTYYIDDRRSEYRVRLRNWMDKNKGRTARQNPPEDLLPPIVDFQAIFIPDGTRALGQIAPMLAYSEVSNVRLIGTNIWNHPDLIKRGEKFIENALFVDSVLESDENFRSSHFFKNYKEVFGSEPGIFEVQAFDSALLLRQLLDSGVQSRERLIDALGRARNFYGALGPLTVNEKREFLRPLVALTVQEGQIQPLSEKPARD